MVHSANKHNLIELNKLPVAQNYFIAYSGGMDSTALLFALSQYTELKSQLTAIHVNHNIHPDSDQWVDHCQQQCHQLDIPLIVTSVALEDHSEASCRAARQEVFKNHLKSGDCLFTAHHLNDQIETVLFRLMRGTGLQGITGIASTKKFDHYFIHRPMISVSQNQIQNYINTHQLKHINDSSNQDNKYSRNHIRNLIVPELIKYEPQLLQNIHSTAKNLQQSQNLLAALIGNNNPFNYRTFDTPEMMSTAIYNWLHNIEQVPPNHKRLLQFSHDCLQAAPDKNPELQLQNFRLIRWHNRIYALHNSFDTDPVKNKIHLMSTAPAVVLGNNGHLQLQANQPLNIVATIRYEQTHEKIKLNDNGQHKQLKKLFQELEIPPWQRKHLPYLYINDQLMAVGTEIQSSEFKKILNQYKAEYQWLSPPFLL